MALPKGKLRKTANIVPIVVKSDPIPGRDGKDGIDGIDGRPGSPGKPGKAGRDGVDGPSLESVMQAVLGSDEFRKLIEKEIGKQTLGALVGGGEGRTRVQDLPGYKDATAGQIFGVHSNKTAGFYDPETLGIISGGGSEAVQYTKLIDTVGDFKYIGEADPGSAESSAVWRIQRVEFLSGDDIEIKWAGGNADFDNAWTNRLSESYS